MSKSRGNVVDPMIMKEKYSAEAFRYLLLREGVPHNDGSMFLLFLIPHILMYHLVFFKSAPHFLHIEFIGQAKNIICDELVALQGSLVRHKEKLSEWVAPYREINLIPHFMGVSLHTLLSQFERDYHTGEVNRK